MNTVFKIGYFADGPWAHGALDLLLNDPLISISFICARSDNPDQYLAQRSKELGIDFLVEANINSQSFFHKVLTYNVDLFVSMSFNQIFRKQLYSQPTFGTINCHAGKLPEYRGRNILNWALINDEREFGITVHYIDDGIDTGDVILQKTYPIHDSDDYNTLLQVAYSECPSILYQAICQIRDQSVITRTQASISSSPLICTRRVPGDELIDWKLTSREIFCFVRALVPPGPCALTTLDGSSVLITKIQLLPKAPCYKGIPGAILAKDDTGFFVKTGDTYIKLIQWSSDVTLRAGGRFK